MTKAQKQIILSSIPWLVFCGGLIFLSLLVFRSVLAHNVVLFTTDDNIGEIAYRKASLPYTFFGGWRDNRLLGNPISTALNWTNILLWLLPLRFFMNWIHAIDLILASLFLVLFLRTLGLRWGACALALLTAYWLGSNLTLTYAGHLGKFALLMFAAAALWFIEKAIQTRRLAWSILAGGAIGGMFLEQQDLALFFGLFWGAYAFFSIVRKEGWNLKPLALRLIPMGVVAVLVAGPTVLRVYTTNVQGVAAMSEEQGPKKKWEFCTQWSVPPQESVDFVAPGFAGWRSHEPEGPYWGRTGQSAEWEDTKQGFRNFRLESTYLGVIPVILALFAMFAALATCRRRAVDTSAPTTDNLRAHIFFWGAVALITLLLSFGKYFPLYQFFYQLPGMSSIRNPNKFLQVFQVAVAILAGFGLHLALRTRAQADDDPAKACPVLGGDGTSSMIPAKGGQAMIRGFVIVIGVAGILLLFWAGIVAMSRSFQEQRFASEGWGEASSVIVGNMITALVHGGVLTLVCAGALWVLCMVKFRDKKILRNAIGWVLIAVVVVDLLMLAHHYIKPVNMQATVGENLVVRYLKRNLGDQRALMLTQSGFYNTWLSVLFLYHNIAVFNVAQMPRMPEDYKRFLSRMQRNPVRMWELSAIGYILTPVQIWGGIQKDPDFSGYFEPVLGYNVFPVNGGVGVAQASAAHPPQHLILKFKKGLPRYSLIGNWEVVPDGTVCERMIVRDFNPGKKVFIAPDTAEGLPDPNAVSSVLEQPGTAEQAGAGDVHVVSSDGKRVVLHARAPKPGILLVVQKYSPDWKATVDGNSVTVHRCNYLCMGVYLQEGEHRVVLRYSPSNKLIWIQAGGTVICLGAALSLVIRKKPGKS